MTEGELDAQDRKLSSNDSDMVLSAEDHLNAFSNEDKNVGETGFEKKTESSDEHEEKEDLENIENLQIEAKKNSDYEEGEAKAEASDENAYKSETQEEGTDSNALSSESNKPEGNEIKAINELNHDKEDEAVIEPQTINKNKIELLEHLLSFIETDDELNYVLVGYFSKFFNLLINKFPNKILAYLYLEKPETLDFLIQHSSKKSIADLISKILLFENFLNEKDQKSSVNIDKSTGSNVFSHLNNPLVNNLELIHTIRKQMLINLFKKLSIKENDPERIANLSLICSEVIENRSILEIVVSEQIILDHLFEELAVDTNNKTDYSVDIDYNYSEILNILVSIVRFVQIENLKIPSYINEEDIVNSEGERTGTIENTLFGEYILKYIEAILNNFSFQMKGGDANSLEEDSLNIIHIDGTFGSPFTPLGNKRVKILELIYCLCPYFKNIQSLFDKILIRSDFFKKSLQYFYEFEWNNLYQLNFENLLKHFINNVNNHTEIIKHLFEDIKILDSFVVHGRSANRSDSKDGFSFNSNRKINHGYFAILIELCYKIYNLPTNSLKKYFSPEWENYVQNEVISWKKLFERKLCTPESTFVTDDFLTSNVTVASSETTSVEDTSPRKEEIQQEESDFASGDQGSNPFTNKKDMNFFNMGSENDDWLNPKKSDEESNDVQLENINDFEFVDDQRAFLHDRRMSKEDEEDMLKEKNE
jgi:hypothetical protein